MAITATKVYKVPIGGIEVMSIYDITFDTSYPTGGYAVTPSTFGLRKITHIDPGGITTGGYGVSWDKTNSKLKLFRTKDPAAAGGADIVMQEVANATNVATEVANCKVIGTN